MRRLAWLCALVLIGDGVAAAVMPQRHIRRWSQGPSWYRRLMHPFAAHPAATRLLGLVEVVAALWWTSKMSDHTVVEPYQHGPCQDPRCRPVQASIGMTGERVRRQGGGAGLNEPP